MTLAAGGAVLILVLGAFAVPAIRGHVNGARSMVIAQRAGFILLIAGLLSGVAMIARGSIARANGAAASQMYVVTGFLKDFHGVTLHGVLVLPALAWLVARTRMGEPSRIRAVKLGIAAYGLAAAGALAVSLLS